MITMGDTRGSCRPRDLIENDIQMAPALATLLQAHRYASMLRRDDWDFAVELSSLNDAGVTNSDLRWLICRHYVEHAEEMGDDVGRLEARSRRFVASHPLCFTVRSCFVLTDAGVEFAERLLSQRLNACAWSPLQVAVPIEAARAGLQGTRPQWDSQLRELRIRSCVIKRFKLPSPNQETLLAAFEEEGWPLRIDDPLPQVQEVVPKRRLHDTIKSLNRNQKHRLLIFKGDGTGEGVCWEYRSGALNADEPVRTIVRRPLLS